MGSFRQENILKIVIRKTIFILILLLIAVRQFWIEPFRIPSESMEPTLLNGDYIWVDKLAYGFHIPFTERIFFAKTPQRGDVIVFKFKEQRDMDFIKRVVGLPGDLVEVQGQKLFINREEVSRKIFTVQRGLSDDHCQAQIVPEHFKSIPDTLKPVPYFRDFRYYRYYVESFSDSKHLVQHDTRESDDAKIFSLIVPENSILVMGDNRDHSHDSRKLGTVQFSDVIGQATSVWLSVNEEKTKCDPGFMGWFKDLRNYRWGRKII